MIGAPATGTATKHTRRSMWSHAAGETLLSASAAAGAQAERLSGRCLAGQTAAAATEQRLGEILARDETQAQRQVVGVLLLLERVEAAVVGMRTRPQLRRLEHVARRVVLLEQSRVEYLTRVDGLIVERDHLHAARPERERREVGRVEATRVRIASYQLGLRVLDHVRCSFFAYLVVVITHTHAH